MAAMKLMRGTLACGLVLGMAGCEALPGKSTITDGGWDDGLLENGRANIWIDPDGCQHWWIDDGVEGYMTPRQNKDGTPYCEDSRGWIVLKDGTIMRYDPAVDTPAS